MAKWYHRPAVWETSRRSCHGPFLWYVRLQHRHDRCTKTDPLAADNGDASKLGHMESSASRKPGPNTSNGRLEGSRERMKTWNWYPLVGLLGMRRGGNRAPVMRTQNLSAPVAGDRPATDRNLTETLAACAGVRSLSVDLASRQSSKQLGSMRHHERFSRNWCHAPNGYSFSDWRDLLEKGVATLSRNPMLQRSRPEKMHCGRSWDW